jgi:hypothetical protein
MLRKALFLFSALFLFNFAIAHADSVKDALDQKYKKQVLALRFPLTGRTQKFGSSGQPVKVPNNGQWVTYGGIYIDKINVAKDTLRLDGLRVAVTGQKKEGRPVFVKLEKSLKFEFHLDQPLQSVEDAQAMLGRVFYLDPSEAAEHIKPEIQRYESVAKARSTMSIKMTSRTASRLPTPNTRPSRNFLKKPAGQNSRALLSSASSWMRPGMSPGSGWSGPSAWGLMIMQCRE